MQGIELNESAIYECVKKGLSVYHGDIETGLADFPDQSFDYVILNQSLQEVKNIELLIQEALRIGNRIIVGFPNFAYLKARLMFFFQGRAPITPSLPYRWYDSPNVRFLSIKDFRDFCRQKNLTIQEAHYLGKRGRVFFWPNLFALNAILVLSEPGSAPKSQPGDRRPGGEESAGRFQAPGSGHWAPGWTFHRWIPLAIPKTEGRQGLLLYGQIEINLLFFQSMGKFSNRSSPMGGGGKLI